MKHFYKLFLIIVTQSVFSQHHISEVGVPVDGIEITPTTTDVYTTNELVNDDSSDNISIQSSNINSPIFIPNEKDFIGGTKGEFSVSLSGAAIYTLPFEIPPGIKEIEPKVGISYNSQSGNGIAGYGWNIWGLSTISKTGSNKYLDGKASTITYSDEDKFILDGQRLVVKSGAYGHVGQDVIYETENYSNLKISGVGSAAYHNHNYFKIEYPDGTIAYYGRKYTGLDQSSTKTNSVYALTYITNPQNIIIKYNYINDNGNLLISEISYGYRSTNPLGEIRTTGSFNSISFKYKNRNRIETGYIHNESNKLTKILDKVIIKGFNETYRTYQFTYKITSLGYEQLQKVTEVSGDGTLTKDPVTFAYGSDSSTHTFLPQQTTYTNSLHDVSLINLTAYNTKTIPGDFSGSGKLGYLMYHTTVNDGPPEEPHKQYTIGNVVRIFDPSNTQETLFSRNFTTSFNFVVASKLLNHNNILLPNQGFTTITKTTNTPTNNTIPYKFDSFIYMPEFTGQMALTSSKTFNLRAYQDGNYQIREHFISGDFNGDGLTDIIRTEYPTNYKNSNYNQYSTQLEIIDLHNNTIYNNQTLPIGFNYHVVDTDGDGYDEFIVVRHNYIHIYKFNQISKKLEIKTTIYDAAIKFIDTTNNLPVYLGDFNGDGKLDFVTPTAINSSSWTFFINQSTYFKKITKETGINYNISSQTPGGFLNDYVIVDEYQYIFSDVNNDGKTDIIKTLDHCKVIKGTSNDYDNSSEFWVYENLNFDAEAQNINFLLSHHNLSTANRRSPIYTISNYNQHNNKTELAVLTGNRLETFKFNIDNALTQKLKSIREFDITTNIVYDSYDEKKTDISTYAEDAVLPFVSFKHPMSIYPKVDIDVAPSLYLVKKVTYSENGGRAVIGNNNIRKQLFSYGDATSNYNGKGFLGFKGVMSTNIYVGGSTISDLKDQIKNVKVFDLDNNGLIKEEYTAHSIDWANFFTTPINFLSKNVNTYSITNLSNKVFKAQNTKSVINEGLTGIQRTIVRTFDDYSNPISITETVTAEGETSVLNTVFTYNNSLVNDNYFIGRPASKTIKMNNVQTSKEEYTYTNNLLTNIRKQGAVGSLELLEQNQYDNFGNIIQKTISSSDIQPRIVNYVYDSSGRYIEKTIDAEGQETNYNYNKNKGWLLSETDPYGLTTSYSYNSFGMNISQTDYLGNISTITYKTNNIGGLSSFFINKEIVHTNGKKESSVTNAWGNKTSESYSDIDGNLIKISYQYDTQNRLIKKSEPYTSTASLFTTFEYDKYGRLIKTVLPTAKEITASYNGLSTTVNDGVKTKTETKNVNNQTKRIVDNGETINYTYNPNGSLKNTNYGGTVISFEYDGWGRRIKMVDPSAGTYTYNYNSIGDLLQETSPNGTTNHAYDSTGKILTTTHSDVNINYIYNSDKLLDKIVTTNTNGQYQEIFSYDNYKRIISKEHITPLGFTYTYNYTFDNLGRILTEEKKVIGASGIDAVKTKNIYKNGYLWKLQNALTNTDLKVYNSFNERGQVTSFSLANGLITNRSYDQYGYLTQNIVSKNNIQQFTFTNTWDVQRGNLSARTNSLFANGINETFQYDSFDRLTNNVTKQGTNIIAQEFNNYDGKGRILNNNVGDYNYDTSKAYQLQNIENLNDLTYYQNNPLQQVTYNERKAPLSIKQQGKENIYFAYDGFNNRTSMFYGNEASDETTSSKVRYYSPAGDIEVDFDKTTNKYIVNMYVDGDPYSASIIQRKENNTTAFYYLHRDYLGSILAITNSAGAIVEKRHFDAWGNILLVQNGQNNNLDRLTFLERGYTGHEHLQGVGLINMNARLYDPKLHRFLAPDNFIQDPSNSQNYNRYGYVMNNPLKFTDPSGEIAIAPILIGMAYGAIIGAATSAVVYSATAIINQQWNWNSFGKSVLFGAVGGAISGGFSGLASGTTSSFLQSTTYNMLSEVASQVGANVIMGNDITYGTVLGSMAGGFVGAKMGQWSGVEGGAAINIIGEIGYNSVKGGARGAVAGGVGAAIDGDNIKNGIYSGTINGMLGGAIQTTAMISTFGHTYKPSEEQLSYVKTMSEKYGVDYNSVAYRKGGLYQLVQSTIKNKREVVWGRNIVTFGKETTPETMGHEFGHIIQSMKLYGWAVFQGRGIFEQLLWGTGAYNPYLHPNSIEVEADKLLYLNY